MRETQRGEWKTVTVYSVICHKIAKIFRYDKSCQRGGMCVKQTDTPKKIPEKSGKQDPYDHIIEKTWEAIDALVAAMWQSGEFEVLHKSGDKAV